MNDIKLALLGSRGAGKSGGCTPVPLRKSRQPPARLLSGGPPSADISAASTLSCFSHDQLGREHTLKHIQSAGGTLFTLLFFLQLCWCAS